MEQDTSTSAVPTAGERKQITAVFLDIVGFSHVASTADAEDLQVWLTDFYDQCARVIRAHDGEITEYLGDGVVALFGLNRASELSASKAATAALAARDQVTAGTSGDTIQLRIGIATGEVVVRSGADADHLPRATGMVTTLARRVQEAAEPGTVLLAESTQVLLRGGMRVQALPAQRLKGFDAPQTLYLLQGPSSERPAETAEEFIGRAAEIARIRASTQPCLIIGPAGIGKSALARRIAQDSGATQYFAADGVHIRASFQPFVHWIMRQIGASLPDWAALQTQFDGLPAEQLQALALVLGLPEGQRLLAERSNFALKALIEESLWQAIRRTAPPGLLIFEDLHWLDNASFGVLVHILGQAGQAGYRVLMTSREDTKIGTYLSALPVTMVPLDPLDDAEAAALLDALGATPSMKQTRDKLIATAAGVPLFLEQLHKRQSAGAAGADEIPATLTDLLAEQIDAAGTAKPVLQCAAVIGAEFDLDLLQVVAADHGPLLPKLTAAANRGLLHKGPGNTWRFAHALLHQAAYQGMLRRTRIDYHAKIADHLQANHADAVRRNPALLTDHLRLSQNYLPAIQNYLAVSQWALFQGAFADAEQHVLAAITLCGEAPAELDVRPLEIACHTALGSIRMQTLGFTAAPVRDAFEKVADLAATQNAHSAANGPAFYGSFTHAIVSGDKAGADEFSTLLRDAAATIPADETNHELQLASLNVDGSLHFYTGDFPRQFPTFAALRDIYDLSRHGAMIATYGADTFAAALMFETAGRSIHGDTHLIADLLAETDAHQALLNIPVMQPWALIWGAVPLFYAGEISKARDRVLKGIATAIEQKAMFWQVTGGAWRHVMDPTQSATAEGLNAFAQVIATYEAIGANIGLPYFRAHYATALAAAGQDEDAYQTSQQAVRENEANGLYCWYPEVLRLHAAICRKLGRKTDAAQYLEDAAALALTQDARLWLIRTRLDQWEAGLVDRTALSDALDRFDPLAQPPEVIRAKKILGDA